MIVDIHSHILPEVDDGSKDLDESLAMARMYLECGTSKVIATPHYIKDSSMNSDLRKNMEKLSLLREGLEKENIDLEVYLGNEIYISPDILEDLEDNLVTTMNNSRYVLLEFPMYDIPIYVEEILYKLKNEGLVPIIAHPERNSKIIEDPNILRDFIDNGCLAQLNVPSIEGKYGLEVKKTGEILLEHNLIHFLGTDCHSGSTRTPNTARGYERVKEILGGKRFNQIANINPNKILTDQVIDVEETKEYKKKFSIKDIFKHI